MQPPRTGSPVKVGPDPARDGGVTVTRSGLEATGGPRAAAGTGGVTAKAWSAGLVRMVSS